MKKIIILIPIYNDWASLKKLLDEINSSIQEIKNIIFDCIVINDASTEINSNINVPAYINSVQLINMRNNKGHARCNAFGIRYLAKRNDYDHVILMDGDGEDRPIEIEKLVEKALLDKNKSVVAKRVKRSEGIFFQSLYQIHKIITFVFTGKNINFGNYSCLTMNDIKILSDKESLWSSFSGSLKKHIPTLNSVNSIRGTRYFGPSKMSLYKLAIHSLSIIGVFKRTVFLRSTILIILLSYFNLDEIDSVVISIFQILLVIFNLLVFLASLRENKLEFIESEKNELSSKIYTH
jgi:hypothetical protein